MCIAHMAPNSKPVVKVERCRQNLNRSLHDLLWFMNYYLATHSMYLDILTASYITADVRTKRKYKCTLCGRRAKDCPSVLLKMIPWSNAFWPGLTPFGPPMWQAEADTELTLTVLIFITQYVHNAAYFALWYALWISHVMHNATLRTITQVL